MSVLHLAMVHGAVYDAVNSIDRRYQPYLINVRARRWYSQDAAAVTAAYRTLIGIVPTQQPALELQYLASLAAITPGRAKDGGIAVGEAAAAAMLAARATDGRLGPFRFTTGSAPGEWRPVLPAFVSDPNAWVARVTPFLPAQLGTGPHARPAEAHERHVRPRARRGEDGRRRVVIGAIRRPDRHVAVLGRARGRDVEPDLPVGCWDDKARWSFWRPITAIREAGTDGNPATDPDPAWLPLLPTPPYPDHPSGHNCLSGSFVATLQDFFGTDRAEFSALSATSGTTRAFSRFSQAIDEIIDARVYSGLHFRSADVHGARLGREVARRREQHYFRRSR